MTFVRVGVIARNSVMIALVFAAGTYLSACGQDNDSSSTASESASESAGAQPDTDAVTFEQFEATEVSGHALVPGTSITISMASTGGAAAFNSGCNTLFGTLNSEAGVVNGPGAEASNGPMGSTMMACDDALMEQDRWLQEFLDSTPVWILGEDTVTLSSPAGSITATRVEG
ncbi:MULTISPECIES: META domain-containing protein [unclassified Rhodococcus (in: high G+C Gram-positive bacteria)]|uniref:META domain-containing protein n=1 Tax=unclassified Rhodococcus (in: high G+C Gram-positive bacteria) TaxID=192944 RepID=UPI001447296E|nr:MULTISPECIES: META domain-containing protein [unclassified Rhodococcus (in: high G+C Gram-positive bacteria)]